MVHDKLYTLSNDNDGGDDFNNVNNDSVDANYKMSTPEHNLNEDDKNNNNL